MKFISFVDAGREASGGAAEKETPRCGLWLGDGRVLDLALAGEAAAHMLDTSSMPALIAGGDAMLERVAHWAVDPEIVGGAVLPAERIRLLAPIPKPAKNVFCVGRNYVEHIAEGARAMKEERPLPKAPHFFTKPPLAVVGPDAEVRIGTHVSEKLDYEVELGVVIGKAGVDIPAARAFDHVFGYTIINDVTARDLQRLHERWLKGKGLDTSCPMGPWIVTRDEITDPRSLELRCFVNGEERQRATVDQMIFDIPAIVEWLSRGITLEPGDVIATGTPSGVGFAMEPPQYLRHGDVVSCEVDGIGQLVNRIVTH